MAASDDPLLLRLQERVASLPSMVAAELARPLRLPSGHPGGTHLRFVVTGIGLSEGPARLLVSLLQGIPSRKACFLPLSAFLAELPVAEPEDATLVIFSQGLSPNVELPLARRHPFGQTWLVTSVDRSTRGDLSDVWFFPHAPSLEPGFLLRILGPTLATVVALRLAEQLGATVVHQKGDWDLLRPTLEGASLRALQALAEVGPHSADIFSQRGQLALLTSGGYGEVCHNLSWTVLEGLFASPPPIWDLLQVAHGPFQYFVERDMTLLVLGRADAPREAELLRRLQRLLDPSRHRVIRLQAEAPGGLALMDHTLQLLTLVVEALRNCPQRLSPWPGQGLDGPLYEMRG